MNNLSFARGGYTGFLGDAIYGDYLISDKYAKDLEEVKKYLK